MQISRFEPLQPGTRAIRDTPIQGVLLTNGDLDHTLGLPLLREGPPLTVYSSRRVRDALTEGLGILPLLQNYCGVNWQECSATETDLLCRDGRPSGLRVQALNIPGNAPKYHRSSLRSAPGDSVAYLIKDSASGGRLLFAPDVAVLTAELLGAMHRADLVLFDGTFWTETEMLTSETGSATAATMGHIPISGHDGSLESMAKLPASHRVYIHINNTNPILLKHSPERKALAGVGVTVGHDGMEFTL